MSDQLALSVDPTVTITVVERRDGDERADQRPRCVADRHRLLLGRVRARVEAADGGLLQLQLRERAQEAVGDEHVDA